MLYNCNMAKKGRFAPPTTAPSARKRTSALMVRVTTEHRRLFEQRAAIDGLSTSSWARMILLREVKPREE